MRTATSIDLPALAITSGTAGSVTADPVTADPVTAGPVSADPGTVTTATWSDWSCLIRVAVTDPAVLTAAVADVESMMRRVERAASRFHGESELSWANVNAGRPVAVSRTLVNLMTTALEEADRSGGAVDPTVGRDLVRNGYDRDITLVADSAEPVASAPAGRPSWGDVGLDRTAGLLTVPPGATLDLGSTAKAQTADWAAADLHDRYGCGVLVELGGDLAVAGRGRDWQVLVAEKAGQRGQQVTLSAPLGLAGLATSSTQIRRWQRARAEINHIIDPATGAAVTPHWRTVTVAADSATHANTCSTAAIVLGGRDPESALSWLRDQGVAARLVDRFGSIVTIGGWPC
jgi:thiamine biosynthesis lipoprotein